MPVETLFKGKWEKAKLIGQCHFCKSILKWPEEESKIDKGTPSLNDMGYKYIHCPHCLNKEGGPTIVVGYTSQEAHAKALEKIARHNNTARRPHHEGKD